MYTLIRSVSVRRLLAQQVPALSAAFLIAEMLYKFKSFTLECLAFLGTWFVLDLLTAPLVRRFAPLAAAGPRDALGPGD